MMAIAIAPVARFLAWEVCRVRVNLCRQERVVISRHFVNVVVRLGKCVTGEISRVWSYWRVPGAMQMLASCLP
jgi:hypothetical protein